MGAVAVLHPRDLFDRNNLISPPMKTHPPPTVDRSPHRRKRSPRKNQPNPTKPTSSNTNNNGPVIGQVKILKRGEELPVSKPLSSDLTVTVEKKHQQVHKTSNTTNHNKKIVSFGPEASQNPQVKQISDGYAGSATIYSPPPSSLPVPAFFKKKNLVLTDDNNSNSSATNDILRLLRLDLS